MMNNIYNSHNFPGVTLASNMHWREVVALLPKIGITCVILFLVHKGARRARRIHRSSTPPQSEPNTVLLASVMEHLRRETDMRTGDTEDEGDEDGESGDDELVNQHGDDLNQHGGDLDQHGGDPYHGEQDGGESSERDAADMLHFKEEEDVAG